MAGHPLTMDCTCPSKQALITNQFQITDGVNRQSLLQTIMDGENLSQRTTITMDGVQLRTITDGEARSRITDGETQQTLNSPLRYGTKSRLSMTAGATQMHSRTPRTRRPTGGAKRKARRSSATGGESQRTRTAGGVSQRKIQTTDGDLDGEVIQ